MPRTMKGHVRTCVGQAEAWAASASTLRSVRGPLRAGSVTEGLLLAGSVLRNEYANKYQKVLLFPAQPGKNQKSLKGSEERARPRATRCLRHAGKTAVGCRSLGRCRPPMAKRTLFN